LVWVTIGAYIALGLLHVLCRRSILRLTEDASAWPRRVAWDFLFFVTQGVIAILIVPVAGVLLAYGLLMIPAAIGTMFSRQWIPALLIGWGAGFVACVLGVIASYETDSPYGPTLMLAMGLFFVLALVASTWITRRRGAANGGSPGMVTQAELRGIR
jgi:zinc/manganese transport system permease protein